MAAGILLGSGAILLFATNLICINLAGVVTFLVQGVWPLRWWDQQVAKKAAKRAITMWVLSLALLIMLIVASQHWAAAL